jgi:hypothetical protein
MANARDRSIEILLRRRRESDVAAQVSPQCLDGEVLAAWMDGALGGNALADAEQHVATCARCQALLASMARTMPEADARRWWQVLSAKWLVPVAAVATALLVWVLVRSPEPAPKPVPTVVALGDSARTAAAAPPGPTPQGQTGQSTLDSRSGTAADASYPKREMAERRDRAGGAGGHLAESKPVPQLERLDALDKTADSIRPQSAADRESAKLAAQPVPQASPSAVASSPPPPGSPPPQRQQQQSTAATPVQPMTESVTIAPEAGNSAAGRGGGAGGGRLAFGSALEIRSPQSDYRWRIVPPAGIHRSVDAGVTWSVVDPIPAKDAAGQQFLPVVLTAGSSPSRDVCWIVGRAGIVLLTTDGATWQRRQIPEAADLTAVRAVDARTATVMTADGRQFVTADGGVTWTPSRKEPDLEQD